VDAEEAPSSSPRARARARAKGSFGISFSEKDARRSSEEELAGDRRWKCRFARVIIREFANRSVFLSLLPPLLSRVLSDSCCASILSDFNFNIDNES